MGHVARLAPSFLPNAAVLEMTYQCNHQCLFCSCPWFAADGSFDTKEELSTDAWKRSSPYCVLMACVNLHSLEVSRY